MVKKIYLSKLCSYLNQCLGNLIINKKFWFMKKTTSTNMRKLSNNKNMDTFSI